ncbi:MAG: mRNA surveillance protein pelota [Nanoarchaeota archaeon]|nr:mRNA surveillance protein pelota [Nanoarchaeota archaeon]MBU1704338.1 mRNA surveillance protein pelota [Nanoarchaeota archaeon]
MKVLSKDYKNGEIKVQIENLDDLWYLSQIIDPKDLVKGKTIRKIKIGGEEDRKATVVKKTVFIILSVEKVDFKDNILRLFGVITEGPEDVPRGEHHTINVEENSVITIIKEKWLKFQIDKLDEASKGMKSKVLICVFDREEAYFALVKRYGYDILSSIKGKVQKKAVEEKLTGSFYSEIIKGIEEYVKKYEINQVIVASPAFWKEELSKHLNDPELKKKIIYATCSSADKTAINEVMKRDEVRTALHEERISKEINEVERLLTKISKNGAVSYGIKETEEAASAGAVESLLVTDKLINDLREKGSYDRLDQIMKSVDSSKGSITIVSKEHDGGKKLDGLGGIGAILRYKIK